MSKIEQIEFSQIPKELQNAVFLDKDLLRQTAAKVLGCVKFETAPWKGKTRAETNYRVYVECGDVLTVFRHNLREIRSDSFEVDDLKYFIDNSNWFKTK